MCHTPQGARMMLGGFLEEPELWPSACRGSSLAFAAHLGLAFFEVQALCFSNQPFPQPPAICDHHLEAFLWTPFLSSLFCPWQPPWCGISHCLYSSFCSPGPGPTFHTDREVLHILLWVPAVSFQTQVAPVPFTLALPFLTERSPGGFFPQTTHSVLPQEVLMCPHPAYALGGLWEGGRCGQVRTEERAGVCHLNMVPEAFCYLSPHTLENSFCKSWHYLLSPISLSHSSSNW